MVVKPAAYYMSVMRTFNGVPYHIIELPFERKEDAIKYAKKRKSEYPAGNQKVVPSKNREYWGVYEKISWDNMPDKHLHPKEGRKK